MKALFRFIPPLIIFVLSNSLIIWCLREVISPLLFSDENSSFILLIFFCGLYSFFYMLWLWAFIALMIQDPGSLEKEIQKKHFSSFCKKKCEKCLMPKPFRTHHCSKCGKCIARFDHHCHTLGICIGLRNIKILLVFLFYSIILCIINIFGEITNIFFNQPFKIYFFSIISNILIIFMLFPIMLFNIKNVCHDRTTYDLIFSQPSSPESNRWKHNWELIFGPMSFMWISPVCTRYDWISAYYWEDKLLKKSYFF